MPVSPGTRLGAYEILSLLGAGGMGEVFVARDPRLGRKVAVKVLPDEVASDVDRLSRFEREARAAAALNHPNVVVIHELSREGDAPFVVMELLDGETLRQRLDRGPLRSAEAIGCATQVARGLGAAHSRGIVHRDLKPDNLFLTSDGVVKILDFGLARLVRGEGGLLPFEARAEGTAARTGTAPGTILGTMGYLSPEQVRGQEADARSDLFALGAVLYEMLSGKRAFSGPSPADTLSAILHGEACPITTTSGPLPAALDRIVRRCLEKRPEDRFHSAHDVALALELVRETLIAAPGASPAGELEEHSPYPGLRFFTEEDAGRFFGREGEIESLWERLKTRMLLAVIGPSGAGKSSFVRAGLVASRPSGWGALVCTPGAQAFRGLGEALAPELASDPDALRKLLEFEQTAFELVTRWRSRHGEALLVVDQLEELYTLNTPEVQQRFAELLGRLAAEGDVHVLLSLRDDFLMRCGEHEALSRVFTELTPLYPLSPDRLRRALEEPTRREGFSFEQGLVEEMLESVEGARGALPLLAFAVSRLWEKRDRETKLLTRAAYEAIGGVAGALAQHAEQTLERIGQERQPIVRELFRNLVTAQGTRASSEREELLSVFPEPGAASEVLQELIGARLLTSYELPVTEAADERAGTGEARPEGRYRIEVVHESLLKAWPRLVWWQAQDEEGAQLRDQLKQAAHLWEEKGRSNDVLWTSRAFREFELWRERYPGKLTALEEEFARAMVARDRRRRNLRRGAIAAGFVLLSGVAAAIGMSRQQALLEARRAEASKLLALAQLALDDDPTEALAYTTASLELADTQQARVFAVRALAEAPPARELDTQGVAARVPAFSPDGKHLAATSNSDEAGVWTDDGLGPLRLGGLTPSGACSNVARWASARLLVAGLGCGLGDRVHVWSLPGGERLRTVDFGQPSAWSVGDERLLAETRDSESGPGLLRSWPLPDGEPETLDRTDTEAPGARRWVLGDLWEDKEARLGDAASWPEARPLRFRRSGSWFAASGDFDPTGRWLVVSTHDRSRLTFWPLEDPHPVVVDGHRPFSRPLAFSPDGRLLATGWSEDAIRVWPLPGSGVSDVRTVELGGLVSRLVFSPDSASVLAVGRGGPVWMVPLDGSPPRQLGTFSEGTVLSAGAVSPSGRRVATAPQFSGGPKTLHVWDLETGHEIRLPLPEADTERPPDDDSAPRSGPEGGVFALHFVDDSTLLSAGDGGLRRWNLETGTQELVAPAEGGTHASMIVSGDGTTALVFILDLKGRGVTGAWLMDLASGERRAPMRPSTELPQVTQSGLDATGTLHVGGHVDGLVSLSSLVDSQPPHLLPGHEGPVTEMAISPDGRWIASAGEDRTLRLWPMPDLTRPPLQSLPHDALLAKLQSLTNLRAVRDDASPTGWSIALDPFPGWQDVPTW